jgi:hypothetical protein
LGRPKGSKNKKGTLSKMPKLHLKRLRLKFYSDMPSSKGGSISGIADQYGRVMEEYMNEKGFWDVRVTGHCIAARH